MGSYSNRVSDDVQKFCACVCVYTPTPSRIPSRPIGLIYNFLICSQKKIRARWEMEKPLRTLKCAKIHTVTKDELSLLSLSFFYNNPMWSDRSWVKMTDRYDCHYCKESLFGKKYVLREENPYCVKCYESLYSNTCEDCKKPVGCNTRVSTYALCKHTHVW